MLAAFYNINMQIEAFINFCHNEPRPAYENGVRDIEDRFFCRGVIDVNVNYKI